MNYKNLAKVWCFVSISFIIFMIALIIFMEIYDINIITKPLSTLVSLSIVIPMAILILSGMILLDKVKKRELESG